MKKIIFLLPIGILVIVISIVGMVRDSARNRYTDAYYQDIYSQLRLEEENHSEVQAAEFPGSTFSEFDDAEPESFVSEDTSYAFEDYRQITDSYISIENTDICYPLVQGEDNKYYLSHLPDGRTSSSGSIFIDYQNHFSDDFNVIVYGHNMRNGSMFAQLKNYCNYEGYAENHNRLVLRFDDCEYTYELFSVRRVEYDSEALEIDPEDKQSWISSQKLNSLVDMSVEPNEEDTFATLYTCGKTETEKVITIWRRLSED